MRLLATVLFTFLVALFGVSCSSQSGQTQPVLQISGFESFVQKFEQESNEQGIPTPVTNLVIQLGDLETQPGSERGICEIAGDQPPTITLDQNYWENVDEYAQESLIFHEMGHCVRNRLHVETLQSDGDPASLMYPYTLDGPTYLRNENIYWPELFQNGPYF